MSSFSSEIEEVDHLLSLATYESIKAALNAHKTKLLKAEQEKQKREAAAQASEASTTGVAQPSSVPARTPITPATLYIPIEDYAWDQGEYNSPVVSIFIDLDGVGEAKDRVDVQFTANSFDLKVTGLKGKNYRLLKDNLDKNIVPEKSKVIVKANKIVLKLQKVKGEFSYEHWTALTAKRKKTEDKAAAKADPMGGLMDMMKDMYEDGDDSIRKVIGEAMMKSQRGEKAAPPSMDDL